MEHRSIGEFGAYPVIRCVQCCCNVVSPGGKPEAGGVESPHGAKLPPHGGHQPGNWHPDLHGPMTKHTEKAEENTKGKGPIIKQR